MCIRDSNYFVKLDSTGGQFDVSTGISNAALEESVWKEELTACSGAYTIYMAVDNELTSTTDGFYKSYEEFKSLNSVFGIAKIAVIAAAVILLILLILLCMLLAVLYLRFFSEQMGAAMFAYTQNTPVIILSLICALFRCV